MKQRFTISAGIPADELSAWLEKAARQLGTFDDGRVNYKHADIAPIILCVVACADEVLLLKRGFGLADAEGMWSVVTGFIDIAKPVKQHVAQELGEELGVVVHETNIKLGESYTLRNPQEKRQYIIFPSLVEFSEKPDVILDSEHTDFTWVHRDSLSVYNILDDLPYAIDTAFKLK
ncbi:MAG TPA: NUDIX domain-containing protein [Candidatus Saccharimonadales bacterium]|nr:NUDIX domain-containing protein [Candidatus Saccharimonadales bacterium]